VPTGHSAGQVGDWALVAPPQLPSAPVGERCSGSPARCSRCLRGCRSEGEGAALRCASCGGTTHAACLHPPLPDRICESELAVAWICDSCAQERCLTKGDAETWTYGFCLACAWDRGSRTIAKASLVTCSLCRASCHRECSEGFAGQGLQSWMCPFCSDLLGQHEVHLSNWSLELIPQHCGRIVPVVRGVRTDAEGPSGMLWRSSEIVHAMNSTMLVTRSRMVVRLSGSLSMRLAAKLHVPRQLCEHFKRGFPWMAWMPLVKHSCGNQLAGVAAAVARCRQAIAPSFTLPKPDEEAWKSQGSATCRSAAGDGHATRKRPRSSPGGWTEDHTFRLKSALSDMKPSTPHFWEQVAARVGRPSEECQLHAFGPARSPTRRQNSKPVPARDTGAGDPVGVEQVILPKKDGPRRAQRIRAFLEARTFGTGGDMLDLPTQGTTSEAVTPSRKAARDGVGLEGSACSSPGPWATPKRLMQEVPSPGCMSFFQSLHTGCTPVPKSRAQSSGSDVQAASASGPPCGSGAVWEPDGMVCQSLLDLGDLSWQPKGVDGFICETRAQRGRLTKTGRAGSRGHGSPARPLRAANLRRAEALFSKLDGRAAAEAALEATPKSVASDSDDEGPPLAAIPPPAPAYPRGLSN